MIPLCIPKLDGNEARYLAECVSSGFVSSVGPFVGRMEEMTASATGFARAVAAASGTAGLHLALTALGVGPGDLVATPSLTFIATCNAVAHCGAAPWLMDILADDWTLDPGLLERALAQECERRAAGLVHRATGRRVAAILPVLLLGNPCAMERIDAVAAAHGLPVVVDAACALGADCQGRPLGAFGTVAVFSFNGNKTVTAGGGGMVCTNDPALADRLRHLSTQARVGEDYDHDAVGFNYRMTNLQAAVGCAQMERLEEFVARKRAIRQAYDEALAGRSGLAAFPRGRHGDSSCWLSGALLPEGGVTAREAASSLRARGVGARAFYRPMHLQPPYAAAPRSDMPVCEAVWERILNLPCSTGLTDGEQAQSAQALLDVMAGRTT